MKARPRAAFVVTFSALSLLGCKKTDAGVGECKPPDCHMNPPPPPERPVTNPPEPPTSASAVTTTPPVSASAPASASALPRAK